MADGAHEQSAAWYRRPLTSGTAFTIAEGFLYLVTTLNLPWWATCLLLFGMWALAVVLVLLSEWTIGRSWIVKVVLCLLAAGFLWALGSKTVLEQYRQAHSRESSQPDITLRFVNPKYPSLQIINQSDAVARDIKYEVVLFDLDHLSADQNQPLPIPTQTFDFVRPHAASGYMNLFYELPVQPLPNDRLFGSASVVCPDCVRGRTFFVYIERGKGGWFAETTSFFDGHQVRTVENGNLILPKTVTRQAIERYASDILTKSPGTSRIPIAQP